MKYCANLPLLTTLDDITLTEREKELAGAIIGEVFDIYINYIVMEDSYRRKENKPWREARRRASRWIFDHRINKLFS